MRIILFFVLFFLFATCKQKQELNSPNSGITTIGADSTIAELVSHLVFVFQNHYPKSTINTRFENQNALMTQLKADSFSIIISNQLLDSNTLKIFEKRNVKPVNQLFGWQAIAILSAGEDSIISMSKLEDGLKNNKSKVLFLKNQVSIAMFLAKKNNLQSLPNNFIGFNMLDSLIMYLENNKESFALLPTTYWDKYKNNYSNISIKGVERKQGDASSISFPYASFIADSTYPLVLPYYTITIEGRSGLGTGFASFIASDVGQRVLLRDGYLPATMPQRTIEISNSFPNSTNKTK